MRCGQCGHFKNPDCVNGIVNPENDNDLAYTCLNLPENIKMKIMKMTINVSFVLTQPCGNVTEEELEKQLTEENKAIIIAELEKEYRFDFAKMGGELISFNGEVEVKDV